VLSKPCREAELLEAIRRHLSLEYRYSAGPARSSHPMPLPGACLLPELGARLRAAAHVADDERLNELIAELLPEQAGMADELQRIADRFAYDELENLVQARTLGAPT